MTTNSEFKEALTQILNEPMTHENAAEMTDGMELHKKVEPQHGDWGSDNRCFYSSIGLTQLNKGDIRMEDKELVAIAKVLEAIKDLPWACKNNVLDYCRNRTTTDNYPLSGGLGPVSQTQQISSTT